MIELPSDAPWVDPATGMVSRRIFIDPEIHELEHRAVFERTWLPLGHESLVAEPHSYITTTMGRDRVILWRDGEGHLGAYLNSCPHRGNTVCLYDEGKAARVRCSYHGWTFASDGDLVAVPFQKRAYGDDLDRSANGLLAVPRVESYGGLIFGSWATDGPSLDEHLGELRWWLDAFLCNDDFGGFVALPGVQRYRTAGNWKFFCDNFVGDRYHTPTSHASVMKLGMARPPEREQGDHGYFMAALEPAHGLGGFFTDESMHERDLGIATRFGPDIVEWVTVRRARMVERMAGSAAHPTHFSFGLCFPNLLFQGIGSAFRGNLIGICHPLNQHESEIQQWVLVERDAPDIVKQEAARFVSRGQSGGGLIGPDDGENFDRIDENLSGGAAWRSSLNYSMGIGREGAWDGQETWHVEGLPGEIGPEFWEVGQRRFYEHWARLMSEVTS